MFSEFPEWIRPFNIGFDILDLIDILKKYDVPPKIAVACIRFYCGRKL